MIIRIIIFIFLLLQIVTPRRNYGYRGSMNRNYGYQRSTNRNYGKNYYVYGLNLQNNKKYVGMTSNIYRRLNEHFSGYGAKWTQYYNPFSINFMRQTPSYEHAKQLETQTYYDMKNKYGKDNVRGAGNTKMN
jgi:predicted GIY-YIG superfamily endonuclease